MSRFTLTLATVILSSPLIAGAKNAHNSALQTADALQSIGYLCRQHAQTIIEDFTSDDSAPGSTPCLKKLTLTRIESLKSSYVDSCVHYLGSKPDFRTVTIAEFRALFGRVLAPVARTYCGENAPQNFQGKQ